MTASRMAFAVALVFGCASAGAQNVRITPLGSHSGELCANDRATLFEDPTGVRILYDAGQTLTGGDDARLGTIHVVLSSTRTSTTWAIKSSRRSAPAIARTRNAFPPARTR